MSRRPLSDEESALWSDFARSITPLRTPKSKPAAKSVAGAAAKVAIRSATRHEPPPKPLALMPFDRRLKQRVARGRDAIDARIDLHGMTQRQAHAALLRFVQKARDDGKRTVLVVTGKGSDAQDSARERGVLRRHVPLWLALPEFRAFVLGFDEAHVSHGGVGALYVRLRRAK